MPIISAENVSAAGGPEQDNNRQAGEWTIDMNITDIKIRKLLNEGRLKAIVSITLDDTIALHDIKIIEGPSRLFVAMPSRRDDNGIFRDIVHPISAKGRAAIEDNILSFYNDYVEEHPNDIPAHSYHVPPHEMEHDQ